MPARPGELALQPPRQCVEDVVNRGWLQRATALREQLELLERLQRPGVDGDRLQAPGVDLHVTDVPAQQFAGLGPEPVPQQRVRISNRLYGCIHAREPAVVGLDRAEALVRPHQLEQTLASQERLGERGP